MNKNNPPIARATGSSTLVKPIFSPGMLLQHQDLEQLNTYTRDLSRLLFRSFFGCGVICGLVVTPPVEECGKLYVTVSAGLALTCSGDPVHVPTEQRFAIDEKCNPDLKGPLWVILSSASKNCAPRTSICTDDDDNTTSPCTRERGMFEIRVVNALPKCVCGYDEPEGSSEQRQAEVFVEVSEVQGDTCKCADPNLPYYQDHYKGMCGCNCSDGSNCSCDVILLARLDKAATENKWTVDHRVRRFIRPVLMRDPQV